MTEIELAKYNGKDGQKAYIGYKGKVYDVTQSPMWKNGRHARLHDAGEDLTDALENAPHSDDVFAKFPVIDTLVVSHPFKTSLTTWYQKYHPHPMLVHFPVALHIFAMGLDFFFFLAPSPYLSFTIFYSFLVATVMGVFAMVAGIFSWWINYHFSMSFIFKIKLFVSLATLILGVIGIAVFLEDPEVVYELNTPSIIYHGTVIVTGITVMVLGYYGGKITWPDKE